jgi:hypothetical protein
MHWTRGRWDVVHHRPGLWWQDMKDIKQRLILREWNGIAVVAFWLALFVRSWPVGVKVARHEVLPQNRSWPIHLAGEHLASNKAGN